MARPAMAEADSARVAAAVTAAEATTDAEIVPVIAERSDAYHDVALQWSLLGMLASLAVVAAVPGHFAGLLGAIHGGWDETPSAGESIGALLVLQIAVFLLLRLVTAHPAIRMTLTPKATRARRVRRRAVLLFRASIEARTATRTGALLYVSLAERRAELVADSAIVAKVPPEAWGEAMAALVDGLQAGRPADALVAAIERVGAVLSRHFPHSGTDPNELPDRLIQL